MSGATVAAIPEKEEFAVGELTPRDAYKLLIGLVVPRPIGFATTLNADGTVNAGPYSFFNALASDPCIVALGIEVKEDLSDKDTARNILERREFVINIVDDALAEAMNVCAIDFPEGEDELAAAGLTAVPSETVSVPRIAEAPAHLECRLWQAIPVAASRTIVLGEVLHMAVRADAVNVERLHVDSGRLDAIGRLGGPGYARTRDSFAIDRIALDDWRRTLRPTRKR